MDKVYVAKSSTTVILKNLLTIVIPCKNEGSNIYECIWHLLLQENIRGVSIIIADSSDDDVSIMWAKKAKEDFSNFFRIAIIPGGYPARARYKGSLLVSTPYVLFLDADVYIKKGDLLKECIKKRKALVSTTFTTDKGWNWVYKIFQVFQFISIKINTPFAVGGFQLWDINEYWKCGGYNSKHLFAEDYALSAKAKDVYIYKTSNVYTSARRFKKKGILWMFMILIKSFINRNNPKFFEKDHSYWT